MLSFSNVELPFTEFPQGIDVTFFDNNFMFEIRYNILVNYVDYFVICESKYDHSGKQKKQNFLFNHGFLRLFLLSLGKTW